jgi:hypothetical protein
VNIYYFFSKRELILSKLNSVIIKPFGIYDGYRNDN